jgi:CubicO group peptidase (beta-lactamase class C family)
MLLLRIYAVLVAFAAFGQEPGRVFTRPSEYTPPPGSTYPAADWERVASPEAAGYSSVRLDLLRAWLKTHDTTAMMVVVGGRVLFEYGNVVETSKIASVRKSVLGMLFGKYIAKDPRLLHATVKDLKLDDLEPFEKLEDRATLQDLLMARSGIYLGDVGRDSPRRGSLAPGTQFVYDSWDFNAAGAAFEKIAGKGIYEALGTDLARPIGMQDYDIAKQKKIQVVPEKKLSVHPEYAMYLSTRDMARLGLLMLRNGEWKGAHVMPKNWVEYLATLYTPASDVWPRQLQREFGGTVSRWGYGAMWWVWDAPIGTTSANWTAFTGSCTAAGTDGQYITVIPSFDLVVAHKNANIDQEPNRSVGMLAYQTILQMLIASRR